MREIGAKLTETTKTERPARDFSPAVVGGKLTKTDRRRRATAVVGGKLAQAERRGRDLSSAAVGSKLKETELQGRDLSSAVVLFHEAIAARLGISSAEWKCLGLLEEHGPLTASRLAELSGFTTGAITGIVDRMERAGYARREPHPSDRRSVVVNPLRLEEVRAEVAPIFARLGRAMQAATRRYSKAELAVISDYLDRVTKVLRNQTAGLK